MNELRDMLKDSGWLIAGLAALWACLHVSPYFPLNLMPLFHAAGLQSVAAYHIAYSISLAAGFAGAALVSQKAPVVLKDMRICAAAAAAAGICGCVLLGAGLLGAGAVLALCLVGVAVALLATMLFSHAADCEPADATLVIIVSCLAFCAIWVVFQLVAHRVLPQITACALVVMALSCALLGDCPSATRTNEKTAYATLP